MELNINFGLKSNGRPRTIITDDRGQNLPCVRGVDINYTYGDLPIATIKLIVDGKRVALGERQSTPATTRYFDCIFSRMERKEGVPAWVFE